MRQLGQIGPIVYLCIKFDVSHLSRSSDISGPKKIFNGLRDPDHAHFKGDL